MDRTTACGGRSLTSCRKAAPVLAGGVPCNFCGCSSVGRARPRHGRGHEFETRHPLHFGCAQALRGHATRCGWPGMCAVLGQTTCSETPRPTGRSRLGTAEVELVFSAPLQPRRVRLDGRGHHPFKVGTRVRIPHATPEQGTSVELTLRGGNRPQSLGGAGTRHRMDHVGV